MTTAAKPSRAIVSATTGEASVHQEENTVSPARRRRARAKAAKSAATSAALLDLLDRLIEQFTHLGADLALVDGFALQILCNFTQNVVIAGLLEVGEHDLLGVSLGIGAAFAELAGGPEPQQLVAASHRLESQLLVMRELLLEAFLALVECGHAALAVNAVL